MIGADLVVQTLQAHGVTFLCALVGNGLTPMLQAARRVGLRVIDTRNEQTASYMAEVYGRLTRQVGVCAVSSAVGHTNALAGLVNARFDGAPVLLLSGASDHGYTDRGKFQDFDQVAVAAGVCKYARFVDRPEKIPFYLHEALAHATTGRPGPVHLTIPQDVLEAGVEEGLQPSPGVAGCGRVRPSALATPGLVREAAAAVAAAQRPLLVAGSGVFYAEGEEALAAFAARTEMPVVVPIWDRGAVPRRIPQFMGVIGSASGSPALLRDADLILLAGARVDYRLGYLQPPAIQPEARILRIDVDPLELRQGIDPHLALQGDPRSVLEQLTAQLEGVAMPAHGPWLEEARRRERAFRQRWQPEEYQVGGQVGGWQLVQALRPFVEGDAVLVVDGGNIGQWAHMLLSDRYPGYWMTCGASGVVGYGIGGAMAARMAYPSRPVILLSGDGSIGFNLADLESASRQGLPFVAIVADDQSWGITASNQSERYGAENVVACALGAIRFDQAAEAFGALGIRIEDPRQLGPAIERGLAAAWPTLIHVPIAHGGPAD
ncbi:MAG: thiamine pyrophosphate-binding protein [Chloroflexota bacterium]